MDTATRILIAGGTSVLMLGLLLGIPMAVERSKAPRAPRYLFAAHLAALIQGAILLALTVAAGFSALPAGVETLGSLLLVVGIGLFGAGLVVDWIRGVEDAFAAKSLGNKVSASGTPLVLTGGAIFFYGVITAL